MIQRDRVLHYMQEHGSITQGEATQALRVNRLASRIHELIKRGNKITTRTEYGQNEYGKYHYTRYTLEG